MLRRGIDLYGREGARRRAATTSYDDELRWDDEPRLKSGSDLFDPLTDGEDDGLRRDDEPRLVDSLARWCGGGSIATAARERDGELRR